MRFLFLNNKDNDSVKQIFDIYSKNYVNCRIFSNCSDLVLSLPTISSNKIEYVSVVVYFRDNLYEAREIYDQHPYVLFIEIQKDVLHSDLEFAEIAITLTSENSAFVVNCAKECLSEGSVSFEDSFYLVDKYLNELLSANALVNKDFHLTMQDYSFKNKLPSETELILGTKHPGAFAFKRKNHIHEGIDVYAGYQEAVYNLFDGVVIAIRPFTGEHTQLIGILPSPWWNDTFCVLVKTKFGVINYGELTPDQSLSVGKQIKAGDNIGHVSRVLKKDKGRPLDMVHLERYTKDAIIPVVEWSIGAAKPRDLLPPGNLLLGLCLKKE